MSKLLLWTLLILLSIWQSVLCAPQFDDDDGPDDVDELDYYDEPDASTEPSSCLCVPFYQCLEGQMVEDGSFMSYSTTKPQKKDEKYVLPECDPYHVCCRSPDSSTVKPYEPLCGKHYPGGIDGGGNQTPHSPGKAEFGEYPWQAAVLKKDGAEFIFKCGGTLIDKRHVLTVAHRVSSLVDDATKLVVRLGEWDTQNTDKLLPHEDYGVKEIIIHPEFRPNNLFNDIAILKLSTDVHLKPHIDTACLPREDEDFTGQECIVSGWGTNAYKNGTFSMIMKKLTLPVIGHRECQDMLRKTRLGKYFKLHSGFMCAGGDAGKDACKGDGGGPLACYRTDNSYTVAGLVAWGIDCGQPGVPGVYVNVKKYIDWILSITEKKIQD